MSSILKNFNSAKDGFALINLALSLAIGGVLMGGLITSIYQLTTYPVEVRDESMVIQQAQNLGYWISRDGQMMQDIDIGDNPGTVENEAFVFSWVGAKKTDIYENEYIDTFSVKYVYDTDRLSRYENLHTDIYDSNGQLINSTNTQKITIIADYVLDIDGSISNAGLGVSATFSYAEILIQRTYDITPRAYFLN